MDSYQEEEIEKLKEWWRENGLALIIGLSIGISTVVGWRLWELRETRLESSASDLFQDILADAEDGEIDENLSEMADVIRTSYSQTFYTTLADLAETRRETEEGKLATARKRLRELIDDTDDDALRAVAELRLARQLIATRNLDEAEQLLADIPEEDETALHWELRGDLLVLRGDKEGAIDFYLRAWQQKDDETKPQASPFLETKLHNLGRKPETVPTATAS